MRILAPAMLLVLLLPTLAAARTADSQRTQSDDRAAPAEPAATPDVTPAAEDWGIWNRAPRRAGRDPLLALGQRDRAPTPEPIDAAARGDATGTAGRGDIDLNAWDSGRIDLPPPPKPDAGN